MLASMHWDFIAMIILISYISLSFCHLFVPVNIKVDKINDQPSKMVYHSCEIALMSKLGF